MKISFLTKPFSPLERTAKDIERRFNYLKYTLMGNAYKAWTCTFPLGGHQDVVDSFIKGAKFFPDVELLINPSRKDAKGSVLYVPSSWRTLRDAIILRRSGWAEKLIAGPLICLEHIDEYGAIITDPAIDLYLLASRWVENVYHDEAAQKHLILNDTAVWAAGVDHEVWTPQNKEPSDTLKNVLVYVKGQGKTMYQATLDMLNLYEKETKTLFCGTHTPTDYKKMLEWSDFVICLGGSETQGLALAQAWSMNRQTLVYESDFIRKNKRNAAPYITEHTGKKWSDISELDECLASLRKLTPRDWIIENQTNKIAFGKFLDIVYGLLG
ncbi:hypothetical protein [Cloacibacillus evryensis]|uniref:hypothetical protein n=1 Tax=Cloacibacillus evryensis TaxID=508460 RepID=UPI00241C26B5|nr:hypothetical protein [Cloacibacillus evryensis]